MKSLAKASRVNTAIKVIQHMNAGMTVVEACQAVGMLPITAYYYPPDFQSCAPGQYPPLSAPDSGAAPASQHGPSAFTG